MKPVPAHRPIHLDHRGGSVQLLQITDCHLGQVSGSKLLGMDTDHSLQAVIDLIKSERPKTDLIVGTGDLSDHGANEAYRRLCDYFNQICGDSFWLAGNHDSWNDMWANSGSNSQLCNEIRVSNWQVVMLNSQVPGEIGGELGAEQLALLDECLGRASAEGLHSLVCLHHQPVAIGSAWIDAQMVADADEFFRIVDRHSSVRGILWGHVHQQIDSIRKGVALLAAPSTCVQFTPNLPRFKVDDQPPGYRWLDLQANGTIDTGVSRVQGVKFTVELDSGGYL